MRNTPTPGLGRKLFTKQALIALAALLAGLLLAAYFRNPLQRLPEQQLTEIETIDTLKAQFNHDAGKTRLILLVSPT